MVLFLLFIFLGRVAAQEFRKTFDEAATVRDSRRRGSRLGSGRNSGSTSKAG